MKNKLWVEKYRPQKLSDYIFQDKQTEKIINQMVNSNSIPHLLFSGVAGTGKTSLSKIIVNSLDVDPSDILLINASDENSVEVMRDKIKNFISTAAFGDYKIVQLEEADFLSLNAQATLRQFMEEYANTTRFILTCNFEYKIMDAIRSRSQHFHFKAFDKNDIAERLALMLTNENIKFSLTSLDRFITVGYPDLRKIINMIQQNSVDGELKSPIHESTNDYKYQLLDLLEGDDWVTIRKLLCSSVSPDEWEDVYRFLYQNLNKSKKFSKEKIWEEGIVIIADHLYKNAFVSDKEINFAAMVIRLANI